jgi:hypothetical protein
MTEPEAGTAMRTHRVWWLIVSVLFVVGVCAGLAGASVAPFAGWSTTIDAAAIAAVIVIGVAIPQLVKGIRRWLRRAPGRTTEQLDSVVRALAYSAQGFVPVLPLPLVTPPTDEELCQAWCASFQALNAAPSRRKFMRLVEERERYLDEIDRRHPAAFRAWLRSDATPSGSPLAYLHRTSTDPPAINWDVFGGQDW